MVQEVMEEEIIRELAKIVGDDYITTDDADLVAYSSDQSSIEILLSGVCKIIMGIHWLILFIRYKYTPQSI